MIVPMKRVTLLCLAADQTATLNRLRDLGVIHLVPVTPPASDDLEAGRKRLETARHAIEVLRAAGPRPAKAGATGGVSGPGLVIEVAAAARRRQEFRSRVEALEQDQAALAPFGHFDPAAVRDLEAAGVRVQLYLAPARGALPAPPGSHVVGLGADRNGRYVAVLSREPVQFPGRPVPLPDRPLAAVETELDAHRRALAEIERDIARMAAHVPVLEAHAAELGEAVRYLEARDSMGTAEPLAYLRGYCPADGLPALRAAAAAGGWGLVIEDPAAGEAVPTLLRHPRWVKPIQTVLDMLGILPGYEEIDVSACFLLFLSLFFAMLVGDAGYGALFLLLSGLARWRFRRAPAQPFALLTLMSVATIVWGVLTGTYFGITALPPLLERLRLDWLAEEQNLMLLCFLIGAIHLTVAHTWNAIHNRRSYQAVAQVGWIGVTWAMFFFVRDLVLGVPSPPFALPMLAVAVGLVVLFMTPLAAMKTDWFNHVMLPLTLVGNFMDVVSYVRLYAVGMASLALAQAFNDMAGGAGASLGAGLASALVLFLGHALNIVLSAMGVLVHGVRLNALEFSSHIGIQWSGLEYRPFAREHAAGGRAIRGP